MEQLLEKLANAKKIMDRSDSIKRGDVRQMGNYDNEIQNFDIPQVKYNIPQEFLQESHLPPMMMTESKDATKPVGVPTIDAIKNSKLPDEIKRLMIEHPIAQAQQPQVTLSNDLIDRAARLMKKDQGVVSEQLKKQTTVTSTSIDYNLIQKMINEAVENALRKNGLVTESSEKTNENFTFKVGKHIFEGKVTKVKKVI